MQPAPPADKPVRSIQESLNLLANTCSDLASNMAKLQSRVDVIDAEKEDRAYQSWANLSNLQGRVSDNFQEAPPSWGLPKTLPSSRRQICKGYNSGLCTRDSSHITNGCTYDHYCSFCSQSGHRYSHSEKFYKKKAGAAGVSGHMHSNAPE